MAGGMTASAYQTPTADGIYYLYNETTGLFMSRGATWGTRALADNYGSPIKLTASDGKYVLTAFDRNTNGYGGQWWMYSDEGTAANRIIEIIAVSDGNYKLRNNLWGTNEQYVYINADGDAGFTNLLAGNSGDQTGLAEGMYLWKFLSQSERDEIIAAKVEANSIDVASKIGYTVASTSELETLIGNTNQFASTNMTSFISSASLESSTSGWTYNKESNRNKNLTSNANGTECFEGCGTLTQTVTGLKEGLYKVTINGLHRDGANADCYTREHTDGYKAVSYAYLDANGYRGQIKSWASDATSNSAPNDMGAVKALFNAGKYLTTVYTYVGNDGNLALTIGFPAFNEAGWYIFDNVTLTYYSDAVSNEDAAAILEEANGITGKMNNEVQSALASAVSTFEGSRTIANYNILSQAVDNAKASVAAYAGAKAYLDEAETILAGTNVYTAASYATYYTEPKAKYEAGTLTTAEASALVKTSTAHRSENTIDDILLSLWTIGGEQCVDHTKNLYINTWSNEGNTDGSNFVTPFFEYWTNDAQSLGATSIVATIPGLTAGETYSFTIRARVRQTDNKTKIANGITMKVGDGEAVDISAGAQFNAGQFYIGNFSAVGTTDAEGKLVATITVAANSNISWLSFYNCKYTEGEDLSAYIADYEFALNTATANSTNTAYAAVTGKEKVDLTAALTTYADVDRTNKAALIAAKEALEAASNAFVAAAPTYTAFAELNANVASTLGVTLPTISETTVAADLKVEDYIVAEYTAATNATNYPNDFTDKLGDWTNAPGTNKSESWDGTATDTYYDLYNKAALEMTQTVTLPAGDYALIAKGRASANGRLTLTDGTETITFAHKGSAGRGIATDGTATFADGATYANSNNGRGWEYRVLTFTSDGETPTTLTFNWTTANYNWVGLDDIVLMANPVPLDYTALQTAYDAVTVPTLGFEAGEYAPYNNVENLQNLSAAKAMLDNKDEQYQAAINAMTTAITGLTWTANTEDVDAVYDGDFANATIQATADNVVLAGWVTKNGNTRQTFKGNGDNGKACLGENEVGLFVHPGTYNYGEIQGYTMPLKAGQTYVAEAKYCAWADDSNKNFTLTILKNGTTVATKNYGANKTACTVAGALKTVQLYFIADENADYVLSVIPSGNTFMTGFHITKAVAEDVVISEAETYTPAEKFANVTFNRTLVEGWNGLVLPFDATVDKVKDIFNATAVKDFTGITYTEGSGVTLDFTDATEVKAGRPFMLKANAGAGSSYTIDGVILPATGLQSIEKAAEGNANITYTMTGTYAASTDLTKVTFALINGTKYYYHKDGDGASSAKAFRAYFVNNSAEGARISFNFGDDMVTGINEVKAQAVDTDAIYNLGGQRVMKTQKGLYIQNGKKVVVK
jgi:hypothetical protein